MSDLGAEEEEEVDVRAEMQIVKKNNSEQPDSFTDVASVTALRSSPCS